jgi:putative hydrolase of the HAD superfamily
MPAAAPRPDAVLLDVGGVFLLPEHDVIVRALERADVDVDPSRVDEAHYRGAAAYRPHDEHGEPLAQSWDTYLHAYCATLGVTPDRLEDALDHLRSAFASMAAWNRPVPGGRAGLEALAGTGVALGVVSNADGTIASYLNAHEILQVGPGPGVSVGCLIDSGDVGVDKPDPRIFHIALEALGVSADRAWYVGDTPLIDVVGARAALIHPFVMDPFGVHENPDFDVVHDLHELADAVRAAAVTT